MKLQNYYGNNPPLWDRRKPNHKIRFANEVAVAEPVIVQEAPAPPPPAPPVQEEQIPAWEPPMPPAAASNSSKGARRGAIVEVDEEEGEEEETIAPVKERIKRRSANPRRSKGNSRGGQGQVWVDEEGGGYPHPPSIPVPVPVAPAAPSRQRGQQGQNPQSQQQQQAYYPARRSNIDLGDLLASGFPILVFGALWYFGATTSFEFYAGLVDKIAEALNQPGLNIRQGPLFFVAWAILIGQTYYLTRFFPGTNRARSLNYEGEPGDAHALIWFGFASVDIVTNVFAFRRVIARIFGISDPIMQWAAALIASGIISLVPERMVRLFWPSFWRALGQSRRQ